MKKPWLRFVQWPGAMLASLLFAASAQAACSVQPATPASFGSVTSFAARNTAQRTSTPNSGMTCTGSLLSVLSSGNYLNATITSANSSRMVSASGDAITYAIFADSAYSTQLNPGTTYNYFSPGLLDLLGIFGGSLTALPHYFQTVTGSNVAAGVYTDTLTINWKWHICSGIGLLGICLGWDDGSGTSTFTVSMTVTNDCAINTQNINFGSAPTVSRFSTANASLSMVCTKGLTYTIGISKGANQAANGRRQMASGANRLQYDLFTPASAVWGTLDNRVASVGAADGLSSQSFAYTAKIYTDQATPPAGTYTDTVVVDVRY